MTTRFPWTAGGPPVGRAAARRATAGRTLVATSIALLLLSLSPAALTAQRGSRPQAQDRERLEQRIRAQMGRMMRARLGLDEAEATRLAQVVQDFEARRRELFAQEQATRRRVEALLLEGGDDQAEAVELMERMAELRLREAALFGEEQEALLDVLTPAQVLRLQALRQELGQRIRALRGGPGGDARRRGGRGSRPEAFRDGPGDLPPRPAFGRFGGPPPGPARVL